MTSQFEMETLLMPLAVAERDAREQDDKLEDASFDDADDLEDDEDLDDEEDLDEEDEEDEL
ncbi:MAG: hypothetical protein V4649_10060 [Bacteroidota bacterium]